MLLERHAFAHGLLQPQAFVLAAREQRDEANLDVLVAQCARAARQLGESWSLSRIQTIIFFEFSSLTPMNYCVINDRKMYVLVSVYQVQVARQSCVRLMETAFWRDILVLNGRIQRFPMHITGQTCSPTWHISYVLVRCAILRVDTNGLSLGWTVHPK